MAYDQKRESSADRLQTDVPHSARVWNFLLGGRDNYAADRATGNMILRTFPDIARIARVQRRFLVRAVSHLAGEAGIRQFLDVGTGLPTVDNTHEVAQRVAPDSRIVYVDNDPLVLVHARALLASTPEGACAYVDADVREPERILREAAGTLDLSKPVALTMLGIMGQLPDSDEPEEVVRRLLDALPPGSYLALSDGTDTDPRLNKAVAAYNDGLALVEPGVVTTSAWRPDTTSTEDESSQVDAICGVGRKP
jgi:hypothetical protein